MKQKHYNMKTMDDFKGTKGDFLQSGSIVYALQEEKGKYRNGEPILLNRFSATVHGNKAPIKENEANAKLFANSKKALEALIKLRQEYEFTLRNQAGLWGNDAVQINKLIDGNTLLKEIDNVIESSL